MLKSRRIHWKSFLISLKNNQKGDGSFSADTTGYGVSVKKSSTKKASKKKTTIKIGDVGFSSFHLPGLAVVGMMSCFSNQHCGLQFSNTYQCGRLWWVPALLHLPLPDRILTMAQRPPFTNHSWIMLTTMFAWVLLITLLE